MQAEKRELIREEVSDSSVSLQNQVSALADRYASRGLMKSVLDSAAEQIHKEEETRAMAPDAYRLSLLSERAVRGCYRGGKDQMSASDLVRYFKETRNMRTKNLDFGKEAEMEEEQAETLAPVPVTETKLSLVDVAKAMPKTLGEKWKQCCPVWFNSQAADTSNETKRFPLSAFAALAAVAMSLMLIVASSVMLTSGESRVSRLSKEITATSAEVAELKSDLDVKHDMQEIRRIAMEEYGMVDQEYLRMQYLSLNTEDSVEAYEEERKESVGLAAILSAMGIK